MTELLVNLDEFSGLCGVTAETMRGHVRSVEGNPDWLVERGDRGRGYKIEPKGGLKWWQAKCEAANAEIAERQEQLAQMRLDLLGDQAETDEGLALSGKKRSEEYAAAFDRMKLRKAMGELVEVDEIEPILSKAAVDLRRRLMQIPAELAAEMGVSIDELGSLTTLLEKSADKFAAEFSIEKVKPRA